MCHQQFYGTGPERWAHFGHNADKVISITNWNVWLWTQQYELCLKEVKTQTTAVMKLL